MLEKSMHIIDEQTINNHNCIIIFGADLNTEHIDRKNYVIKSNANNTGAYEKLLEIIVDNDNLSKHQMGAS